MQPTSPDDGANDASEDDEEDDDGPLQFGEPLHHSLKRNAEDNLSADNSRSPPAQVHRQLDLEDFANSPAADAEDVESEEGDEGHDVEMRIALG